MIWYLPIEHEEMRYTKHLDDAICNYLQKYYPSGNGKQGWVRIYPNLWEETWETPIPKGMFLNAPKTIAFKSLQIFDLTSRYMRGQIQDGDIVFLGDMWFPGIEAIRYLDFFCKKKVKLRGILHAGSFTDTDFIRQLERWAAMIENAWFDMFDQVIVASNFIKQEVCSRRLLNPDKVIVSPFPLDPRATRPDGPRENIVIFNGRLCDEKQPWLLEELAGAIPGEFVNTQKAGFSKDNYFHILKRAKCVVSFALQENFGFGIAEAVVCGCLPVVPDRLVYPEFYPACFRYKNLMQCTSMVRNILYNYDDEWSKQTIHYLQQRIKPNMSQWFSP